ncbi:MAG TPA: Mur ligase family protein [Candidatus Saccharimonadales bacterium]|nr:Mur ligase family protein [Candidatus Saccharimonadales bacterium]
MKADVSFKPVQNLAEAQNFLARLPKSTAVVFTGNVGFERSRYFFNLLGNPQDSFRSIHIAGTSGKSSTAYMTAALLQATGLSVGLTLSPHVHDVRERMLIDGNYISESELCDYLNALLPVLEKMRQTKYGLPSYFEINLALAWLSFRQHGIDYAVVETGLGGRLDSTNTITRPDKLAVLTAIGYDHTQILGSTLEAIAGEKAGIIQPHNHVIALRQSPEINQVLGAAAAQRQAELELIEPDSHLKNTQSEVGLTGFDLDMNLWQWLNLQLSTSGGHQLANAVMALRAVQYVAERDGFKLSKAQARSALGELIIPARFEIRRTGNKLIVLDGAHNPQKMAALGQALRELFPNQKLTFLVALKQDKDSRQTLRVIVPLSNRIILSSFVSDDQDLIHQSAQPEQLARDLAALKFTACEVVPDPAQALAAALDKTEHILVITGSFYLIGQLYPELDKLTS